jgi:hypothetical protein
MTDKQFDEFLRQQSNKTDITDTSFWVSSRDDKGNSEWKHYRTFDSISMFTPGLVVLAIIISWIMSISGCSM